MGENKDMAGGIEPVHPEVKAGAVGTITADGDSPTEEEKQTLRKVSDTLPWSAFIICIVELCERFTYYGLSGPVQNYVENDYGGSLPGALGMGQTAATGKSSCQTSSNIFESMKSDPFSLVTLQA